MQTNMLSFDSDRFTYGEISDVICSIFPAGVDRDDDAWQTFPGIAVLADRLASAPDGDEWTYWEETEEQIRQQTGLPVISTTYGQAPCWSGYVQIADSDAAAVHLHFYVSLLGPWYFVTGDYQAKAQVENRTFRRTLYLAASPVGLFVEAFDAVAAILENRYPGYKPLPFSLVQQQLKEIEVPYAEAFSLFAVLFGDAHIDISAPSVGDTRRGAERWLKEGASPDTGWIALPPLSWLRKNGGIPTLSTDSQNTDNQ